MVTRQIWTDGFDRAKQGPPISVIRLFERVAARRPSEFEEYPREESLSATCGQP